MKRTDDKAPFIAIITVVRNGERYIESTIRNVASQTFRNFEFIVVDGASTDRTVDIIRSHQNQITCWLSEEDKGIYDAMNKGLKLASAQWIIFMNAGDTFFDNQVLERFERFVKANDIMDLVYGDVLMVSQDNEQTRRLNDSFSFLIRNMICHQCIFYACDLFRRVGDFDTHYKMTADFEHLLRIKWGDMKIHKIDSIIARYRMDGISSEKSNIQQIWKERIQILRGADYLPRLVKWSYLAYAIAAYEFRKRF